MGHDSRKAMFLREQANDLDQPVRDEYGSFHAAKVLPSARLVKRDLPSNRVQSCRAHG
jgi:hypothetical protein